MMIELLKYSVKSNYKILLVFMTILTLYFVIIVGMYDPNGLNLLDVLAQMKLAPELLEAFGFTIPDASLVGFLSSYFYGLLMIAFPMIFYIILANKLVAGLVDKGSMAHLLASPHSRIKIITTQLSVILIFLVVLIAYITVLGVLFCEVKFSGALDLQKFILLNGGVLLLHFSLSSVSFLCSSIFNETRYSLFFGAGIPIFFLIMQMLAHVATDNQIIPYLTLNSLYKPQAIIAGEGVLLPWLLLVIVGASVYSVAIFLFNKKDMPV